MGAESDVEDNDRATGVAGDEMLTETASFNPITPYGATKVRVEADVSRLADGSFSPTFLRNATAYGVSPCHSFDLVLNNLVDVIVKRGKTMFGVTCRVRCSHAIVCGYHNSCAQY